MMGFDVQLIVNATLQMLIEKLKDGKYSKINWTNFFSRYRIKWKMNKRNIMYVLNPNYIVLQILVSV